jgi:hypothetical protein
MPLSPKRSPDEWAFRCPSPSPVLVLWVYRRLLLSKLRAVGIEQVPNGMSHQNGSGARQDIRQGVARKIWRRGSESNRRIKVLQTSPLPLGYRAPATTLAFRPTKVYLRGTARSEDMKIWSGRRDLNPRLRPWQGRTLPLSYSRSAKSIINDQLRCSNAAFFRTATAPHFNESMRTRKPTLRGTKWLGTIPVEAECTACDDVKFKAISGSHRPDREEYTNSLQRQFEAHVRQVHARDHAD